MNNKITVAVDIDGVIYDVIGHMIDKFKPHLGQLRPSAWDCWPELETTKKEFFEMYAECWKEAAENPKIGSKYTDKYSYELFNWLQKQEYIRISILTKRGKNTIADTIKYIHEQDFHYDTLTIITDEQDKRKESFDVIIEDNPKNFPSDKLGILITQEWNKNEFNYGPFIRVDRLSQVPSILESVLPFWIHQKNLLSP